VLDRFSHFGFVFFENLNVDIRGDFSVAMTEVLGKSEIFGYAECEIISWQKL